MADKEMLCGQVVKLLLMQSKKKKDTWAIPVSEATGECTGEEIGTGFS